MKADVLILGGSGFIGTNLLDELILDGFTVKNFDISKPLDQKHKKYWIKGDILNKNILKEVINSVQPTNIVDLIARTDVNELESVEEGYSLNYKGVQNVIDIVKNTDFIKSIVFTSTQYVKRPGHDYENIMSYNPHTTYGASKVMMEKIILNSEISCKWTIIRPTNVWGPWHFRYKNQFFKVLKKRMYFHPGGEDAIKSYAYVGNVAHQISKILIDSGSNVDKEILYVGDEPISILKWVNLFSRGIAGKNVVVVPRYIFIMIAKIGDFIGFIFRKPFLINSSRFNSMTEHYPTAMNHTFQILGKNKYTVEEGVNKTLQWLKD